MNCFGSVDSNVENILFGFHFSMNVCWVFNCNVLMKIQSLKMLYLCHESDKWILMAVRIVLFSHLTCVGLTFLRFEIYVLFTYILIQIKEYLSMEFYFFKIQTLLNGLIFSKS